MTDTVAMRTPCEHGYWWEHYWETPTTYGWRLPRVVSRCPGGREIKLRRPDWFGDRPGGNATEPLSMWVEVGE